MYTASASFKQNLDIFEFKNITLQIKIWTDHHCHRVPKIERVSKCVQTFEHIMDTFWTLRCILDTLFKKSFLNIVSKMCPNFWTQFGHSGGRLYHGVTSPPGGEVSPVI